MSEYIYKSSIDDPETVKVRNRVFAIALVAIAITPFIVYTTFVKTKTEVVSLRKLVATQWMKRR